MADLRRETQAVQVVQSGAKVAATARSDTAKMVIYGFSVLCLSVVVFIVGNARNQVHPVWSVVSIALIAGVLVVLARLLRQLERPARSKRP